jgi:hypothetical protein
LKFAIKASYGERIVDGNRFGFNIQKDPITSSGKKSKAGELKLVKSFINDELITVTSDNENFSNYEDLLEVVFENGEIKRTQQFEEIRTLANSFIKVNAEVVS